MTRPLRRRPRPAHDPDETRAALLAAGAEAFASLGLAGARVEQIARRAGVNKAMISYHFGGKRGLYTAVLTGPMSELCDRIEPLRRSTATAADRLGELAAVFAALAERRPDIPVLVLREVLSGGGHLDRELATRMRDLFAVSQEIVEQGVAAGELRPVEPFLTHFSIIGSLVFFFATRPFRERMAAEIGPRLAMPSAERFVAHLQELIAHGLCSDGEQRSH